MEEKPEVKVGDKVNIEKSSRFFFESPIEAAVSGPSPQGKFYVTFLGENANICSRTIVELREDDKGIAAKLGYSPDDTKIDLQSLGCLQFDKEQLGSLAATMLKRLSGSGNHDLVRSIIAQAEAELTVEEAAGDE